MATVDGRPAQYGISLKQLREVMELRGSEAVEQLRHYGGVQELCKKLYTSPTEGKIIPKITFAHEFSTFIRAPSFFLSFYPLLLIILFCFFVFFCLFFFTFPSGILKKEPNGMN
jgi:hypothetical protein